MGGQRGGRAVTHGEYLLSLTIWTKIQTLITPGVDNTCRAVTHSHGSVLTLFFISFCNKKYSNFDEV